MRRTATTYESHLVGRQPRSARSVTKTPAGQGDEALLLRVDEVATLLRVSERSVWRMRSRGCRGGRQGSIRWRRSVSSPGLAPVVLRSKILGLMGVTPSRLRLVRIWSSRKGNPKWQVSSNCPNHSLRRPERQAGRQEVRWGPNARRDGKSRKWYGEYTDAQGIVRRTPLAADKMASQAR